jgi:long-chain acyl-CoA synthetase
VTSREALVTDPRVIDLYDRTVKELTKDQAQYERIKRLALLPRDFSIETGELTPKLSVKRRVVEEKYKALIDRIYDGSMAPA